jgi:hypothetical protein
MTLKQIEDLFDSVNGDYLTIEDMKTALSEELGIEFKETEKESGVKEG